MNIAVDLKQVLEEVLVEVDGVKKLDCGDAHRVSAKHGISLSAIGEYCNREGIRIIHCELGCF